MIRNSFWWRIFTFIIIAFMWYLWNIYAAIFWQKSSISKKLKCSLCWLVGGPLNCLQTWIWRLAFHNDIKKQGCCYSKREEAAWPILLLNNNDPFFCTLLFAKRRVPGFLKVADPKKNLLRKAEFWNFF